MYQLLYEILPDFLNKMYNFFHSLITYKIGDVYLFILLFGVGIGLYITIKIVGGIVN